MVGLLSVTNEGEQGGGQLSEWGKWSKEGHQKKRLGGREIGMTAGVNEDASKSKVRRLYIIGLSTARGRSANKGGLVYAIVRSWNDEGGRTVSFHGSVCVCALLDQSSPFVHQGKAHRCSQSRSVWASRRHVQVNRLCTVAI